MIGIGLRAPHHAEILRRLPALGFLEVHAENFFADGGPAAAGLERFRAAYPLSLHGVGLSLGSTDALDRRHLARLAALARRFEPVLVSEHLCWSSFGGRHAHELLPLPYSREALEHVVARIGAVQDALGREILVENVSTYVAAEGAEMPEWEFVAEAARRSGCRLLLDVNNIWVNARNHGFDARRYLAAIPPEAVGQFHLAGHEEGEGGLLIDTHGARVSAPVWSLYEEALARFGARPTLVEWDTDIPALDVLLDEAAHAGALAHPAERAA
ncbi:MAG TPA: DUF692 domain-containing protein [Usitatibacter sp.]|nr:DUF692 domain-containing protein [Usitatibacter sp.]